MNLSSVIFQETVDNIRERVLTMWPDGVIFQTYRDETNEYLVQFSGNPWTSRSTLGQMAMKLILELFAVLARQVSTPEAVSTLPQELSFTQGYICISAIDTGHTVRTVLSSFKVCIERALGILPTPGLPIGSARPVCAVRHDYFFEQPTENQAH